MENRYKSLKEESYEANMQLHASKLVIHTFGNVSAGDRSLGVFAIKPSGLPYLQMKPGDMVVVDFDGATVDGGRRPSSDTRTHAYLYSQWTSLGGIAHSHAPYSVAWAQALRPIPILGTTHADHLTADIPCTPPLEDELIRGDYELNTGIQIVRHFNGQKLSWDEIQMVLLGAHGPFSWGKNAEEAVYNSMILETLARMAYMSLQLNPELPRLKESLIRKHYERKHGKDAYYGQ